MKKKFLLHLVNDYSSDLQRDTAGVIYKKLLTKLKNEKILSLVAFHLYWQPKKDFESFTETLKRHSANISNIQKGYKKGEQLELCCADCKMNVEDYIAFRDQDDEWIFYGEPEGDFYEDPRFFSLDNEIVLSVVNHEYIIELNLDEKAVNQLKDYLDAENYEVKIEEQE